MCYDSRMDAPTYYRIYGQAAWHEVCRAAGLHTWTAWALAAARRKPNIHMAVALQEADPRKKLEIVSLLSVQRNPLGVTGCKGAPVVRRQAKGDQP